jgi:hypothetical protein
LLAVTVLFNEDGWIPSPVSVGTDVFLVLELLKAKRTAMAIALADITIMSKMTSACMNLGVHMGLLAAIFTSCCLYEGFLILSLRKDPGVDPGVTDGVDCSVAGRPGLELLDRFKEDNFNRRLRCSSS